MTDCSPGKHETCAITDFKYGVANRGASIRIPRDTEKSGKGLPKKKKNVVGSVQGKGGEETLGGSSHLVSV